MAAIGYTHKTAHSGSTVSRTLWISNIIVSALEGLNYELNSDYLGVILMVNSEMANVVRAAYFAGEKHKDQRRSDIEETPYINHPLELASILVDEGDIGDPVVICAALLHDTIEDTNTTIEELNKLFGSKVAGIVAEVTNDMSLDSASRKVAEAASIPNLSHEAKLVKLADKLANIRDISTMPPVGWTLKKKEAYFDFALSIAEKAKEASPTLFEIFLRDYKRLSIS